MLQSCDSSESKGLYLNKVTGVSSLKASLRALKQTRSQIIDCLCESDLT